MDAHQLIQLTVNGLINGSAYALLGVSFALIFGVSGRFHFALAFTYTLTAYLTAVCASSWGVPVAPAIVIGLLGGAVLGVAIEALVYEPLGDRAGADPLLAVFVASLGITIAGQSAITLLWGLNTQSRTLEAFTVSTWHVGSVTLTNLDLLSVGICWLLIAGVTLQLALTSAGRRIRAVRSNPEMAQAVGIASKAVYRRVFAIGSLLAGVAAILYTLKFAATPEMGQRPVFYALVVAFLGGTGRPAWMVGLTGIGLGLIESLSGNWVSAQWSSTVVFAVLLVYLAARSVGSLPRLKPALLAAR